MDVPTRPEVIPYALPDNWIKYDPVSIVDELTAAKAAVLSLSAMPLQRSWAENLQAMELKREVAGTSKIEGADFTDRELDAAISGPPKSDFTRSQRQARAAMGAYKWIASLPVEAPIDENLIKEIHRRIVTGCDDDHCAPGELRGAHQNVAFGRPRHRGVEGGPECASAFRALMLAFEQEFRRHDPIIRALALHYHIGGLHPFQDGNGRTARAAEALVLRKSDLRDTLFISMSNYYYDEKDGYLSALADVSARGYDLTPFLKFGLAGIASQCRRLLKEIRVHVQKSLFRDVMHTMYGRLASKRKRALASREMAVLKALLDMDEPIEYQALFDRVIREYVSLKNPGSAYVRDLNHLGALRAILIRREQNEFLVSARLEWPTEITETEFYDRMKRLPEAKTKLIVSL